GCMDEPVPPLVDRRHWRGGAANGFRSWLQPLAWLRAGSASAREERARVRRVREPPRRRRRDHGHAADLAGGAEDAGPAALDAEASAGRPARRPRPGAARLPRGG